ncbi:MAG: helix-turn-helix transcriptional regulator [Promethearchaeota archaeon]
MKFKKKIKSKVKDFREKLGLTQQQLADKIGVSRQTIYYLEKGDYNPSLTISFKLSEIFNEQLDMIFYQEPFIKDLLGNKTLDELESISETIGIKKIKLIELKNLNETQLALDYKKNELEKLSQALGYKFEDLFEE